MGYKATSEINDKILIADDMEIIRELVKKILESSFEDLVIYEASDGNEAIEMAKKIKPKLLILDVMMPGKSGYQVCKEIKKHPDTKNIFVFFLTGRIGSIATRTMKICGGDDFLRKPFVNKEFLSKVEKALGVKAAKAEVI